MGSNRETDRLFVSPFGILLCLLKWMRKFENISYFWPIIRDGLCLPFFTRLAVALLCLPFDASYEIRDSSNN